MSSILFTFLSQLIVSDNQTLLPDQEHLGEYKNIH